MERLSLAFFVASLFCNSACATTEGSVRLVGGLNPWIGYVEVTLGSRTGWVCDDGFSLSEAYVICKQMGYGRALNYLTPDGTSNQLKASDFLPEPKLLRRVVLRSMKCNGLEKSWEDCTYRAGTHDSCADYGRNRSMVICENFVRLRNGSDSSSLSTGSVAVKAIGQWSSVCLYRYYAPLTFAASACRDIGFHGAFKIGSRGMASLLGPEFAGVKCRSPQKYTTLLECELKVTDQASCPPDYYLYDGLVQCGLLRLAGGGKPSQGRVEVYDGSQWRPMCTSRPWKTEEDANNVCEHLGYSRAISYKMNDTSYGQNANPFIVYNSSCTQSRRQVSPLACVNRTSRPYDCYMQHAVSVSCADADECRGGLHRCSGNALCNNTEGSYTCTCLPGYAGSGQYCEDVNECLNATEYGCVSNETCRNLNGSFECVCASSAPENASFCIEVPIMPITSSNGTVTNRDAVFIAVVALLGVFLAVSVVYSTVAWWKLRQAQNAPGIQHHVAVGMKGEPDPPHPDTGMADAIIHCSEDEQSESNNVSSGASSKSGTLPLAMVVTQSNTFTPVPLNATSHFSFTSHRSTSDLTKRALPSTPDCNIPKGGGLSKAASTRLPNSSAKRSVSMRYQSAPHAYQPPPPTVPPPPPTVPPPPPTVPPPPTTPPPPSVGDKHLYVNHSH